MGTRGFPTSQPYCPPKGGKKSKKSKKTHKTHKTKKTNKSKDW